MKVAPCALALLIALVFPVAAHAETVFTFTPAGESSITFTLDPSILFSPDPGLGVAYGTSVSSDLVGFVDPTAASAISGEPVDFEFQIGTVSLDYEGVKLYSGSENDPTFLVGAYDLGLSSYFGNSGTTATLVISNSAATPEPSSFFLLGTGVLGFAGTVRRRFSKP